MELLRFKIVHSLSKKLFIFILFVLVQASCLSQNSNQDVAAVPQVEESPKELNNDSVLFINNPCVLEDHLDAINYFLKPIYVKRLTIVIAYDAKDAISVAKYFSRNNQMSLENKEELLLPQQLLYDQVANILHLLYYNNETSNYIFVYPRNMQNEILETYLTQMIINSAKEINVILTCEAEFTEISLNRMFQVASNILVDYLHGYTAFLPLSVLPFDELSFCKFVTAMRQVEKYLFSTFIRFGKTSDLRTVFRSIENDYLSLTTQETLVFHTFDCGLFKRNFCVLGIAFDEIEERFNCTERTLYGSPEEYLNEDQYNLYIDFNNSINLNDTDNNLKCFQMKLSSLNLSSTNMTTLTDVFVFSVFVESIYKNISSIIKRGTIFKNICNSSEKLEFIKQYCFLKYFYGQKDLESLVGNYLLKELQWFPKLVSIYKYVNTWDKSTLLLKLQKMYDEITNTNQYDAILMKNAFSIVKNYTVKIQMDVTCFEFMNGTYKLQVKGKFISLGRILRKQHCPGKVKLIEIFALEKIIIDEDLIEDGEGMQVNIIAPIWEIVSNRTINLDGASADNGTSYENKQGFPGLPGRPGGTLFAIIETVVNSQSLRISSNGGRGGDFPESLPRKYGSHVGFMCSYIEGVKGAGGIHGVITLFPLNKFSMIDVQLSVNNGTDGNRDKDGGQFMIKDSSLPNQEYLKYFIAYCTYSKERKGYYQPKKSIVLENFEESVKRYRKFILSETLICKCSVYAHLYIDFNNNKEIPNNYDTLNLIDELIDLETYYSMELNKTVTLHLFEAWSQGFRDYILHRKQSENTIIHTRVLLSLDTIVSRKINKLKSKFYDNSILLIETYLEACILESENLENAEILVDMKTIKQRFKAEFEEEIKKAKKLLSNELQDSLTKRIDDLNIEIKQLVEEIDEMIKNKTTEVEELKKTRQKLQSQVGWRVLFGFLQFAFLALSFINPVCAIVGTALRAGLNVLETKTLDSYGDNSQSQIIHSMNRNYQLLREMKKTKSIEGKQILKGKIGANFISDAVELGIDRINKISKDKSAIDQVNDNINQNLKDIKDLEDYKSKIHEELEPIIERIHTQLVNKNNEFYNSSITLLEFQKWRIDDYLSDVSSHLEIWTKKFDVEESVKVTMEKIKKGMETVIHVHILIKELHYKIESAQFLSDTAAVPYQLTNIEDREIRDNVEKVMHIHFANDIIDENSKWTIAFEQYTFPFVTDFTDPSVLLSANIEDPLSKAKLVVEKMKFIRSHLYKRRGEQQSFTSTAKFGNGGPFSPFYTWNTSLYSSEIKEILEGKTVKLFANISDIVDLNAVKFRDINIMFNSSNTTVNEELRDDLLNFSVSLTHNGDSYYRCNHDVQLIKSGTYKFRIKFFMDRRKRFVNENLDYVLSPFATWTISLWNNRNRGNFTALAKYANNVNLELVGDGQFLDPDENNCDTDMKKYYKK